MGSLTAPQLLSTFSSVLGTVGLVFYTFPLLGIIFAPMSVLYYMASIYYRRSSVETKRLDSLMRSALYGSYSGMKDYSHFKLSQLNNNSRVADWSFDNPSVQGAGESGFSAHR